MAVDLGTDVRALDDYDDPEIFVSGPTNLAYALGRRLITPTGALEEIGETQSYDSIDIRDWLGRTWDTNAQEDLQAQAQQVIQQDPRVLSASVSATMASGVLSITVSVQSQTDGTFKFVAKVDDLTASILMG